MSRIRVAVLSLVLASAIAPLRAQDPVATIPGSYAVQFENAWVRLVKVHYPAGATLPVHSHPAGTTAYVYLNASAGVVFRHASGSRRAVTRPAVTAGSVRIATGSAETHNAENPSATASDFLRVQFKTDAGGVGSLRRRIPRGPYPAGAPAATVEFTNGQMRLTRLIVPRGSSAAIGTADGHPALLIALSPATLTMTGSSQDIALVPGQERWIEARQHESLRNTGAADVELLRFDFLTPPR
jgi:hypothetical protein